MNWPKLIQDLASSGLTQKQIAEKCGIKQAHVSRLLNGQRDCPNWVIGDAMIKLYKKRLRRVPK